MELTTEQFNILAHVVIAPQEWADHARTHVGECAVLAKIEKYKASYEAEKDLAGYQTRAQREQGNV